MFKFLKIENSFQISNLKLKINKGFTLIELLIVVSIIGILIGAVSVSWTNAQVKSRDGKRKADLKAVQQALETYFNVNGSYPSNINSNGRIRCNTVTDTKGTDDPGDDTFDQTILEWGQPFACDNNTITTDSKPVYLTQLPKDPTSQLQYYYFPPNVFKPFSYTICAKLENTKDQEVQTSNDPCTDTTKYNYWVTNP